MGASEKFCLKWNDFESNISIAFRDLRSEKDFFDVTLACDDNAQIEAHKTILSACSPFFRGVLRRNPHQHPLLYLKGVKHKELQAILDFMYMGEVNVAQEELNSFLAVAEDLRVKGLTQGNNDNSSASDKPKSSKASRTRDSTPSEGGGPPPSKKSRPSSTNHHSSSSRSMTTPTVASVTGSATGGGSSSSTAAKHNSNSSNAAAMVDDDDIQEVVPVKTEPASSSGGGGGGGLNDGGGDADNVMAGNLVEHHDAAADNAAVDANDYDDPTMIDPETALEETYGEENYDYGAYEESYDESGGMMDPAMPIAAAGADGNKDDPTPLLLSSAHLSSIKKRGGNGKPPNSVLYDSELYLTISTKMSKIDSRWYCLECDFTSDRKYNIMSHVEAKHVDNTEVACDICDGVFANRRRLRYHVKASHSNC